MADVGTVFREEGILDDCCIEAPKKNLTVKYDRAEVNLGQPLTPTQVKDLPTSIQWDSEPNALYTLVFIDLDGPSRQNPTSREALHWLVINVKGGDYKNGDTIVEFIGSGPPEGSGLHRYVFLVYKQNEKIIDPELKFVSNRSVEGRRSWKVKDFVSKHKLVGPVAGNFYQVKYESAEVNFGQPLTPTQVKDLPVTIQWDSEHNALYTLIMIDLDAPSRQNPTRREVIHWLVLNVNGCEYKNGETLVEYRGSGPPQGTGLHRYVFLVYKQNQKINDSGMKFLDWGTVEERRSWKVKDFVSKHKLIGPVAGNFFQAEYDDYCAILHKQLENHGKSGK